MPEAATVDHADEVWERCRVAKKKKKTRANRPRLKTPADLDLAGDLAKLSSIAAAAAAPAKQSGKKGGRAKKAMTLNDSFIDLPVSRTGEDENKAAVTVTPTPPETPEELGRGKRTRTGSYRNLALTEEKKTAPEAAPAEDVSWSDDAGSSGMNNGIFILS